MRKFNLLERPFVWLPRRKKKNVQLSPPRFPKSWGYPQSSSILDWDFPWNQPSIFFGTSILRNPQICEDLSLRFFSFRHMCLIFERKKSSFWSSDRKGQSYLTTMSPMILEMPIQVWLVNVNPGLINHSIRLWLLEEYPPN